VLRGLREVAHRFLHAEAQAPAPLAERARVLADPAVDLVALERDKIKGAIRTDFILSAEIVAITLGTVASEPFSTQLVVLAGIAVAMTVGVYGFVAGIVKLDDLGLWLSRRTGAAARALGSGIVRAAPWLMKALSFAGTVAMFLVGGGILVHGVPPLHHAIVEAVQGLGTAAQAVLPVLADGALGVLAGGLVLAAVTLLQRLRRAA